MSTVTPMSGHMTDHIINVMVTSSLHIYSDSSSLSMNTISILTNSIAYGPRRFNIALTMAL